MASFGDVFDHDLDVDAAMFYELDLAAEERVKLCMIEQGWDYSVSTPAPEEYAQQVGRNLPPAEYAATAGFGLHLAIEQMLTDSPLSTSERGDANEQVLVQLSPQAREGWQASVTACENAAATDPGVVNDLFRQLDQFQEAISVRVEADSQVIAAKRDWVQCMAEAGFAFDSESSLVTGLVRQMNDIVEEFGGSEIAEQAQEVSPALAAAISDFRQAEVEAAIQNEECVRPVRDVESAVRQAEEESYFAENAQLVEQWTETLEAEITR